MKKVCIQLFFLLFVCKITYGQKILATIMGDHLKATTDWGFYANGSISVEYLDGSNKRIYSQNPFNYNLTAMHIPGMDTDFTNNAQVVVYVNKPLIKVISATKVNASVNSIDHLIATTDWSKYATGKFLVEELDGRNQHIFEALPHRPYNPNALRVIGLDAYFAAGTDVNVYYLNQAVLSKEGNISINTTNFNNEFSVNGKIRAREIKVEVADWPDYVFEKSYVLPPLKETEIHIKEKGHLPGIPSAEEVKANGIDLGEMNAKLLQKIEELTLHLIEKDKEIKAVKSDYQELRKLIMNLK